MGAGASGRRTAGSARRVASGSGAREGRGVRGMPPARWAKQGPTGTGSATDRGPSGFRTARRHGRATIRTAKAGPGVGGTSAGILARRRRRPDPGAGPKDPTVPTVVEVFESRILRRNPLSDPHVRRIPDHLPPSYTTGRPPYSRLTPLNRVTAS